MRRNYYNDATNVHSKMYYNIYHIYFYCFFIHKTALKHYFVSRDSRSDPKPTDNSGNFPSSLLSYETGLLGLAVL